MQVNDPVTPVKCFPRRGRLSVDTMGPGNFRQMLVNFDFFIKQAAIQNNA